MKFSDGLHNLEDLDPDITLATINSYRDEVSDEQFKEDVENSRDS